MIKDRYYYIDEDISTRRKFMLMKAMSYTKKSARFMPNPTWGIIKLFDEKRNRFPIGLIERAKKIIPISYTGLKKVPTTAIYGALRPYQKEALNQMFKYPNGIVKIPTGGGKTRVAIQYIKNYPDKKFLVLVPTLDLVQQWSEQVPNNVHVKTYMGVKKKAYIQQFDCLIMDECHHVAAKTLFKIGINIHEDAEIFGFSGTPLNRDDDNLKIEAVLGTIIFDISTKKLIEQGYLCNAKVYYHSLSHMMFGYTKYHDVYEDYIVNNHERNYQIVELAKHAKYPCLLLINRIEHGEMLKEMLKDEDVVFLNGQSGKDERYDNKHDIIIATSIYDEGVDLPNLKTLILASGGKSSIKATQRLGRLLRPSPDKEYAIVHDFKDDCKWLDEHYKARRKIFEKDFEVVDDN